MTLPEFSKLLHKHNGNVHKPIMVWQHLESGDEFSKIIEHEFKELSESDFVRMARMPVEVKVTSKVEGNVPATERITFYPNIDRGWESDAETEIRIHLYYEEK